jgi:uncharacterized protein YutE (UPF0331/DUF86 family)
MRDLLDDMDGIGEVDASRLEADRIVRHAVERIITQLVDLAVSVSSHISAAVAGEAPATYRDSFSAAAKAGAMMLDTEPRTRAGVRTSQPPGTGTLAGIPCSRPRPGAPGA